jgi:acyl-CoA thioester hydrolase
MINSSLPLSPVTALKPEWIDFNGHLNMAYYMVLFDHALDHYFEKFGMGPLYITQRNLSTFAVEAKITYLKELLLGDEVQANLQVLDVSDKAIHYGSELYRVKDGALIAVLEGLTLHMDMNVRRPTPFPADILSQIHGVMKDQVGIPIPDRYGKGIAIRRK